MTDQQRELEQENRYLRVADDPDEPPHLRELARILLDIPRGDRTMVSLDAQARVNLGGGRYSDAVRACARAYHRDPEAFREQFHRVRDQWARERELERAHLRAGTSIGRAMSEQMDRL